MAHTKEGSKTLIASIRFSKIVCHVRERVRIKYAFILLVGASTLILCSTICMHFKIKCKIFSLLVLYKVLLDDHLLKCILNKLNFGSTLQINFIFELTLLILQPFFLKNLKF